MRRDLAAAAAQAQSRKRLFVVYTTLSGPKTTGELCAHFVDWDRCTVMQHLGVLEKAELVIIKREGRHRWNYLNVLPIKRIHDRWISPYATAAVDLLDRLKRDLET
ncbi:ArsR/SmtB family transcription factor [Sorangium sp. So ce363]|uniref:ArsR/SmtB family transcription factor n=1 Tax=Sorangium sp. So ce363 TaxID=3133304 RepID=UPI003F5FA005